MLTIIEFLATLSCTLFTGAAIYVNLVEHPARLRCDTQTAFMQWAPSYKRATVMQASLAIIGSLTGSVAWLLGAGGMWLIGAILLGAVVPFTFIAVMPTNHTLLEPGRDLAFPETRALLEKWGRLHAARSVLSFLASLVFIWLLVVT